MRLSVVLLAALALAPSSAAVIGASISVHVWDEGLNDFYGRVEACAAAPGVVAIVGRHTLHARLVPTEDPPTVHAGSTSPSGDAVCPERFEMTFRATVWHDVDLEQCFQVHAVIVAEDATAAVDDDETCS